MFTKENNPHKNKGKMISLEHEKEDHIPSIASSEPDKGPHYPTTYISHKNLPKMKPGQKVKLHGVVKSFSTTERSGKEGDKMDNNADIDIHHMEPMEDEAHEPKPKNKAQKDEEAIEEGLAAAENNGE